MYSQQTWPKLLMLRFAQTVSCAGHQDNVSLRLRFAVMDQIAIEREVVGEAFEHVPGTLLRHLKRERERGDLRKASGFLAAQFVEEDTRGDALRSQRLAAFINRS